MGDHNADIDFATGLGDAFLDVFAPVVGPDVSRHDFYSAIADTLSGPVTAARLRALTPADLSCLRQGFARYFECEAVEERHLRRAIERTLWAVGS